MCNKLHRYTYLLKIWVKWVFMQRNFILFVISSSFNKKKLVKPCILNTTFFSVFTAVWNSFRQKEDFEHRFTTVTLCMVWPLTFPKSLAKSLGRHWSKKKYLIPYAWRHQHLSRRQSQRISIIWQPGTRTATESWLRFQLNSAGK